MDGNNSFNLKAALYCRLSVEDREKQQYVNSESILNQQLLLKDFAKQKNWDIYDIYIDDDFSGLDQDRPEFNRMLKDASEKKFNIILCKSQSRFTRDNLLVEKYIHRYFPQWQIRFVSITDNIDTEIHGNKKARQINGLINEWYSEDISENIRSVFKQKQIAGQFLGSFAPYGYEKSLYDKHKLVPDKYASAIVKEIYELYVYGGYGYNAIASILTKKCIPCPSLYRQTKEWNSTFLLTEKKWSGSSIAKILSNEVYIGHMVQHKQMKISYKSKKVMSVPEENQIRCLNTHDPIIPPDLFYKADKIRKEKCSKEKVSPPSYSNPLKIICGQCNGNIIKASKNRKGETYLKCALALKSKAKLCSYHTIKLESLEELIQEKITELIKSFLKNNSAAASEKFPYFKASATEMNEKIEETKKILQSLSKDKENHLISHKEFDDLNRIYQEKLTEYTKTEISAERFPSIYNPKNFSVLVSHFISYVEIQETASLKSIHIHWQI